MTGPLSDDALTAEWWAAVEAALPSCKCSHAATLHDANGHCWSAACGCIRLRPKETA